MNQPASARLGELRFRGVDLAEEMAVADPEDPTVVAYFDQRVYEFCKAVSVALADYPEQQDEWLRDLEPTRFGRNPTALDGTKDRLRQYRKRLDRLLHGLTD